MNTLIEIEKIMIKIGVNPNLLVAKNSTCTLTGKPFNSNALELVYLLLEVEKRFKIKIDEKDLIDNKFNSIANINALIEDKLSCITRY